MRTPAKRSSGTNRACYYDEGLDWQRGSIVDPALDRNTSPVPILSSAVADCLIGLALLQVADAGALLWLAAEQQNAASTQLFGTDWCWPVDRAYLTRPKC